MGLCLILAPEAAISQEAESRNESPRKAPAGPEQMFRLGNLDGEWANVYVSKLAGDLGRINLSMKKGEVSHLTMVGLIRIESDKLDLRCENLQYDAGKSMEARYNVFVDLHDEDIQADCELLVYDLVKNTITLTGEPYVRGSPGDLSNFKSMTITLKEEGDYDIAVDGSEVIFKMGPPGTPGTVKSGDQPTTPVAPREIDPGALRRGILGGATPTPSPERK